MSDWTHALCDQCWDEREPGREVSRLLRSLEVCCDCGVITTSGIFYRASPDTMPWCDHDGGFFKMLPRRIDMMNLHVENLIERVAALEAAVPTE